MTKQSIPDTIGALVEPQLDKFMDPIFDLAINLPARKSRELLRALYQQLRAAIISGRLQPGVKLPATRKLASVLNISRNTVIAAYDLLLSEGYVDSHAGAGTYVANLLRQQRHNNHSISNNISDTRLNSRWRTPPSILENSDDKEYLFNFQVGAPDLSIFPFEIWRRLSNRALQTNTKIQSSYAGPAGQSALREAIAKYVSYTRAVACESGDILVTSGAQQAFDILARVLVTAAQTIVAVEEPGYPPMRSAFMAAGATLVTIPVDGEGLVIEYLPSNVNVICVTPSHQFPFGVQLSSARRAALLDFASTRGATIIEDDYDGEFRYGGKPVDALQTLDQKNTVFYIGTFSKSMFPSLRLGFIVVPPWAKQALLAAKQLSDWHSPVYIQDTLAAFIHEGHLARHIRKVRKLYNQRREILLHALKHHCGNYLQPIGAHTGLHLTACLNHSLPASNFIKETQKRGIKLCSLERYYLKKPAQNGIVFGYGQIHHYHINTAIYHLASVLNESTA